MARQLCMVLAGTLMAAVAQVDAQQNSEPQEELELSGNPIQYEILDDGRIVLIGQDEDLDVLERLLLDWDQPADRPEVRVVQLENAPAADLAQRLGKLYQSLAKGKRAQDTITIVADEGSNSLLIAAPTFWIEEIVDLATQLDTIPRQMIMVPETIQLEYIPASEAVEQVNEALQEMQKRMGGKGAGGLTIIPNDRNNTLLITAPPEDIEKIRALLKLIDVEPIGMAKAEMLFIPLLNAQSDELQKSLEQVLSAQGEQAKKLKETILRLRFKKIGPDGEVQELPELDLEKPIKIVSEPGTNSLIIATHDQNVQPITEIVKLLDTVPTAAEMGIEFYPLKYADAETVAGVLTEMFEQGKQLPKVPDREIKGAVPDGIPGKAFVYNVGIHADTRINTVVVSGRPEQLAIAHTVITQLDMDGGFMFATPRLYYLEHTDAERMAKILTDLNEQTVQSLEARKAGAAAIEKEKALILSDIRSNALIISATDDKFEEMSALAQKLDGAPESWMNEIRIINCDQTNAADLESKVVQLWDRKAELRAREDLPQDKPVIVTDQRSNSLVVASNIEDFESIKRLIEDLEAQPLAPLAMIRLVEIENNDAGQMGDMLKQMFDERLELRRTDGQENNADKVAITADGATNTMLVACSPENYAEILRIVERLDILPDLEGVIKTFKIENSDAANVASKIKDLFDQGIYTPAVINEDSRSAKIWEKLAIISDARSNAVMISASKPAMSIIEQLILQMDSKDALDLAGTHIYQLTHLDAIKAADILRQVFEGVESSVPSESQEIFIMPTIIPVEGSNALIVTGSRDGMTRTEDLLRQIDAPSTSPTAQIQVYALRHAPSVKLAPKLQQIFEERVSGSDVPRTPISIQAVEGSNSIISSASLEDHTLLSDLITRLDVPSNLNQQLRIFSLEKAPSAEDVAQVLADLFEGAGEEEGMASAVSVQPVPWTNSIAVWAAPGQMEDIAEMIAKVDTSEPTREMMFDVIQLQQAEASELADAIAAAFEEQASGDGGGAGSAMVLTFLKQLEDGTEEERRLIHQGVSIVPYTPTNSLMVLAPPDSAMMLRELIRRLDEIPPLTADVEVVKLFNANAEQTIDTLEQIFDTDQGGDGEAEMVIGGATGIGGMRRHLTFAADQRTNSVIVAGHSEYLGVVRKLITDLDLKGEESRDNFVYKVDYSTSDEVATAIEAFNEQERNRLADLEETTSAYRTAEQTITVVSDEGSNSVVLGMSPRYRDQYMDIVQELDRPPDQVLIECMFLAVQLDNRFELGMEFTWQDLAFSQKAVEGPNGIIQGPNKDVVLGTDLGAVGSGGGFSITVTGEDFAFLFHALQTNSRAELISRPSVVVEDNEQGLIRIFDDVPVPAQSGQDPAGNIITNVQYEQAGIELEVTPHINPDGYVQLETLARVESIGALVPISSTINAPAFQRTELDTTITIRDGETVILGGLIVTDLAETENKVPILGDLPVVGQAFRVNTDTNSRNELLVVLTATVIQSEEDFYRASVKMRDNTSIIPESVKTSPLMDGLQVRPLGEDDILDDDLLRQPPPADVYGPQPTLYGPPVPQRVQRVSYSHEG